MSAVPTWQTLRPRRSTRKSFPPASTQSDPIVIDDDDSVTSPDKSGLMSRRSSASSTPATSDATGSVDGREAHLRSEESKPAKARRSPGFEVVIKTRRGGAGQAQPTDLTLSQNSVASVEGPQVKDEKPLASTSRRSSRRSGTRGIDANSDPVMPSPVSSIQSAAGRSRRLAAASKGKGKAKASSALKSDDDEEEIKPLSTLADYAMDSDDEEALIKQVTRSAVRTAQSNAAKAKGKGRAKASMSNDADEKEDEAQISDEADAIEEDSDESEYEPDKAVSKRHRSAPKRRRGAQSPQRSEVSEVDDEETVSEESSSEEEPLAGPSADGGAYAEEQRWETAKQRAKRLKREAREARINANARRTGRKRKVDKRTHYQKNKDMLVQHHPELAGVWEKLAKSPKCAVECASQPPGLTIKLLPFQLEGLNWLTKQEKSEWKGGILADEMGMGKTIQIISLFLSDRKKPNLVVAPTVAILQWRNEIAKYTTGFKVVVWHGANRSSDSQELASADVVLASYGVLESAFRKQVQGFRRKGNIIKEKSAVHGIEWHRVILDEAHNIKERATNTAKAAFELKSEYRWCLSGTPLQNRVGELYSMIRFLNGDPFSYYYCKKCDCKALHWLFSDRRNCDMCGHTPMHHVCFWNNDILKPIVRYGTVSGEGREAFGRMRLLLDRMMLRRTKLERADDMGLPPRTIEVRRDMFNEEEEDLYESLYSDTTRKFSTYLDQGTILNNYSNIFTLLTRMRQLACHPDLVLRSKTGISQKLLGDQMGSIHVCRICQDEAEDAIMSKCRHIFCRECVRQWVGDGESEDGRQPECPYCHATLTIDLEGETLEPPRPNDERGARQGILARLDMNNWRSSSKIEALVEELNKVKSEDRTIKSLVFSQFVNFLDLIAFRLTRAGFNICRLEGNMSPEARNKTIEHFMNNPGVTVFLVSLKAGGVALNLTEASRVYLMDPWWNPSVEVQAMDRIHRLGQHRPIVVKRMVIENSIESRIIELQNKKSAMIEAAIGKDDSAMGRLSVADLSFLFSL